MKTHPSPTGSAPSDWFPGDPSDQFGQNEFAELDAAWLHWTELLDKAEGAAVPPPWRPPHRSHDAAIAGSRRENWRVFAVRALSAAAATVLLAAGVSWSHRAAISNPLPTNIAGNQQSPANRETTSGMDSGFEPPSLAARDAPLTPPVGSTSDAEDLTWDSTVDTRLNYVHHLLRTIDRKLEPDEVMLERASWAVYALALEAQQSGL